MCINEIKVVNLPNNDKLKNIRTLFAQKIKAARVRSGLLQKQLASALNIDVPMYSRIERGDRQAKKEQVVLLSDILNIEREELLSLWIADKINAIIGDDKNIADKALKTIIDNRNGNKDYTHAY
jgi:transcriptional regulator with XRE-family HTH domain